MVHVLPATREELEEELLEFTLQEVCSLLPPVRMLHNPPGPSVQEDEEFDNGVVEMLLVPYAKWVKNK